MSPIGGNLAPVFPKSDSPSFQLYSIIIISIISFKKFSNLQNPSDERVDLESIFVFLKTLTTFTSKDDNECVLTVCFHV